MQESAANLIRALPGQAQSYLFANRLLDWLAHDLDAGDDLFTESRARALLLSGDLLDDPTRNSFGSLVETEAGTRLALADLLQDTGLAENDEVRSLAATAGSSAATDVSAPSWLALIVAAYAWRNDFLLNQLDPASPPEPFSPAGQVLKRSAYFTRQQIQRSATERDKLLRQLTYSAGAAGTPSLETLPDGAPAPPLPPYYRPPIPVKYPEYSRETIQVDPDAPQTSTPPAADRGEPIKISDDDLASDQPSQSEPTTPPTTLPPIRIDASQVSEPTRPAPPAAPSNVTLPDASVSARTNAYRATRQRSRNRKKPMQTTKLRVEVKDQMDGKGLYGLQVRVGASGIRRYVAGTTNEEGQFTCELPVYADSGLTYDIDVTWPRDFGGEVERKSITLNADRTMFTVPFYHTLKT